MLHSIVLLAADLSAIRKWPPAAPAGLYPSLLLNPADKQLLNEAYRFFSNNTIEQFSISIAANGFVTDNVLQELVSFLFMPTYYTAKSQRIIHLLGTDRQLLNDTGNRLTLQCHNQGIENLAIRYLTTSGYTYTQATDEDIIFNRAEELFLHYRHTGKAGYLPGQAFFLYTGMGMDINEIAVMMQAAENEVKNANPAAYELALALQALTVAYEHQRKEHLSVLNELNNYKLHLETLRSSHQAKELQDYYSGEYEILPLWYKRFGHVLKVMMGKRRLRSLFNDKLKKYRD